MDVIPFNVPGLPDTNALTGNFVIRPVTIDASDIKAGPMLGLHATAPTPANDGLFCLYPGTNMISYLCDIQIRSGQKDLNPGMLVYSASVDGSCTLFSLSYDINDNPVLAVTILPQQYLSKILVTHDGTTIADVSGIDDRLEFTQVFTANSYGAIQRLSNDLTHKPKESGNAIFDLQKDLDVISDIASFYLTRALTLAPAEASASAAQLGGPDGPVPRWALRSWRSVAAFSFIYVVMNSSFWYRNLNGAQTFGFDYNRNVNRIQRRPRDDEGE